MLRLQPFNHFAAAERVGDVADARHQRRHFIRRLLEGGLVAAADDHLIAFGKSFGKCEANAGRAAGDEDCIGCEFHGRTSFYFKEKVRRR